MDNMNPISIKGYQVLEVYNRSTRHMLYKAIHTATSSNVIIKVVSKDIAEATDNARLFNEYNFLKDINSPNVVKAIEFLEDSGVTALSLSLHDGLSLQDYLKNQPGMDVKDFIEVALKTVKGIADIHAAKIIHKDINPRNIIFNQKTKEIVIIDFGIAERFSKEVKLANISKELEGSLEYISPEQTGRMNRELDYRSDYYSLGMTLFELIAGKLPFEGKDALEWIHCHIAKSPKHITEFKPYLPLMLDRIIAKLIAKDPEDRYQSYQGIATDLQRCLETLDSQGSISEFPIGASDISQKFIIPKQLFGRDDEIMILQNAFFEATEGKRQFVVLSGLSGVGKTTLVAEIYKHVVAQRGFFVSGKQDQLNRSVPLSAFTQAINDLARQLLTEPDDVLASWKKNILSEVGELGKLITDFVPIFAKILGEQPKLPDLKPTEYQALFRHTIVRLLSIFATKEHPLVFFIDNLQWADSSTLALLESLFHEPKIKHMMFIAAVRNNELTHDDPVLLSLKNIRENQKIVDINLVGLSTPHLEEMLLKILNYKTITTELSTLRDLLHQRTQGNPYFITETLKAAYDNQAIYFVDNVWKWNLEAIREISSCESAVELAISSLRKLPEKALHSLKFAATIGSDFELKLLTRLMSCPLGEIIQSIDPAIEKGIVYPISERYKDLVKKLNLDANANVDIRFKFAHDQLKNVAYTLDCGENVKVIHLALARHYAELMSKGSNEVSYIAIAEHYANASEFVTTDEEKIAVIKLNLAAAQSAQISQGYAIAEKFLNVSLAFLSQEGWANHFELTYATYKSLAINNLIMGNLDGCQEFINILNTKAKDPLEKAKLKQLEANKYRLGTNQQSCLNCLIEALGYLNVSINPKVSKFKVIVTMLKLKRSLKNISKEQITSIPKSEDKAYQLLMTLLMEAIIASYMTGNTFLNIYMTAMIVEKTLKYGSVAESAQSFIVIGAFVFLPMFKQFKKAKSLVDAGYELGCQFPNSSTAASTFGVYAHIGIGSFYHHSEQKKAFEKAVSKALELGDTLWICNGTVQVNVWEPQMSYNVLYDENCKNYDVLRRYSKGAMNFEAVLRMLNAVNHNFVFGRPKEGPPLNSEGIDVELLEAKAKALNYQAGVFYIAVSGLMESCYFFEFDQAFVYAQKALLTVAGGKSTLHELHMHFFGAIAYMMRMKTADRKERKLLAKQVKASLSYFKLYADNNPKLLAHYYLILNATYLSFQNNKEAGSLYDKGVNLAHANHFYKIEAFGALLAYKYYEDHGMTFLASAYLQKGLDILTKLRAHGLVEHLTATLIEKTETVSGTTIKSTVVGSSLQSVTVSKDQQAMDFSAVIKAAQSLSGEVVITQLLSKMCQILSQLAGATSGRLFIKDKDSTEFFLQASFDDDHITTMMNKILKEVENCPQSLVSLVIRTKDKVIIGNAKEQNDFSNDPYITNSQLKSILCQPIVSKGEMIGLLYLENSLATNAFTQARVEALNIIGSQASISIENAILYTSLEKKVQERTVQLADKNRKINAILQNMQQGIFTFQQDLLIDSEYAKYLETIFEEKNIAGINAMDFLLKNATLSQNDVNQMISGISVIIGEPSLSFEMNAHVLPKEIIYHRNDNIKIIEIAWEAIFDDKDNVEKIMVVARDVTELRKLQQQAKEQATELAMISQILEVGFESFTRYIQSTLNYVTANEQIISGKTSIDSEDIKALYRNMHTIKGNSRTFGFVLITDASHECEAYFDELRHQTTINADMKKVEMDLLKVRESAMVYVNIFEGKLGQSLIDKRGHDQFSKIKEILAKNQDATSVLNEIRFHITAIDFKPISKIVENVVTGLADTARSLDKDNPEVTILDNSIMFDNNLADDLKDVFMHLLRNAIDHGIESKEKRLASGKSSVGHITIEVAKNAKGANIYVSDDGAGLSIEILRAKALKDNKLSMQAAQDDLNIAMLIFESGVSTSKEVTNVSGKGVGMDAVRATLLKGNNDISIEFTSALKDGKRLFRFNIAIDAKWIVNLS